VLPDKLPICASQHYPGRCFRKTFEALRFGQTFGTLLVDERSQMKGE
jgi:hypothetical protein